MKTGIASVALAAALALAPMSANAISFSQPASTAPGNFDTEFPNVNGWNVSAAAHLSGVEVDSTLDLVDREDPTLFISYFVEYTTDASGDVGWQPLFGGTWEGGFDKFGQPRMGPFMGPFETTNWPPNIKRLRIHVNPSRTVNNLAWTLNAN